MLARLFHQGILLHQRYRFGPYCSKQVCFRLECITQIPFQLVQITQKELWFNKIYTNFSINSVLRIIFLASKNCLKGYVFPVPTFRFILNPKENPPNKSMLPYKRCAWIIKLISILYKFSTKVKKSSPVLLKVLWQMIL